MLKAGTCKRRLKQLKTAPVSARSLGKAFFAACGLLMEHTCATARILPAACCCQDLLSCSGTLEYPLSTVEAPKKTIHTSFAPVPINLLSFQRRVR